MSLLPLLPSGEDRVCSLRSRVAEFAGLLIPAHLVEQTRRHSPPSGVSAVEIDMRGHFLAPSEENAGRRFEQFELFHFGYPWGEGPHRPGLSHPPTRPRTHALSAVCEGGFLPLHPLVVVRRSPMVPNHVRDRRRKEGPRSPDPPADAVPPHQCTTSSFSKPRTPARSISSRTGRWKIGHP